MSPSPQKSSKPDPRGLALARNLGNLSTTAERISALVELGFSYPEIGTAVGVSDEAVRGWKKRNAAPRRRHGDALDDLRSAVLILLEGEIAPERVRQWFVSNPKPGDRIPRPMDVLNSDPQAVAAAAVAQIHNHDADVAEILRNARLPDLRGDEKATAPPVQPALDAESFAEMSRERRVVARERQLASGHETP